MKVYHGARKEMWHNNVVWTKGTMEKKQGTQKRKGVCGDAAATQPQSQGASSSQSPSQSQAWHLTMAASYLLQFPTSLQQDTCQVAAELLLRCAAQQTAMPGSQSHATCAEPNRPQPVHQQVHQQQILDVPDLKPHGICITWDKGANWDSKGRHEFPIKTDELPDIDPEFITYLKGLKNKDIGAHVLGAKRFLSLVCMQSQGAITNHSLLEVMLGCYHSGTMDAIMNSELMSSNRTWSRPLNTALRHMVEHLKIKCGRRKLFNEKAELDQMLLETLKRHSKLETKEKKKERRAKKKKDAASIKLFASVKRIKKAVKKAMKQLQALVAKATAAGVTSAEVRAACNTLLVGIIFHNGFAGRSYEWSALQHQKVNKAINIDHLEYLICSEYKTDEQYGDLAKYLFNGTIQALRCYMQLPGNHNGLLLQPATSSAKQVSISYCMERFNKLFLKKYHPTKVNLLRKYFHTVLHNQACLGQVFGLLKKVDAHSLAMAKNVYTTCTPEDDAKLGKYLFEQVFGAAVEWPQLEECLSDEDDITALQQHCKDNHGHDGGGEDDGDEGGCCEESMCFCDDDDEGGCCEEGGEEEDPVEASDMEANIIGEPGSEPEEVAKRGRPPKFSVKEKDWLISQTMLYNCNQMFPPNKAPSSTVIDTIILEGKTTNVLHEMPDVDKEGYHQKVRHVLRWHRPAKFKPDGGSEQTS
jgi:hypothetical protein